MARTNSRSRDPRCIGVGRTSFLVRPAAIVANVGAMIFIWHMATLNPNKQPMSFSTAILLGIAQGLGFMYLLPWICCFVPCNVRLTDGGYNASSSLAP